MYNATHISASIHRRYTYMYEKTPIYIYTYMYEKTPIYLYVRKKTLDSVCTYKYTFIHAYIYINPKSRYVYIYSKSYIPTHTHIYIYVYMYIYMQRNTYVQTNLQPRPACITRDL